MLAQSGVDVEIKECRFSLPDWFTAKYPSGGSGAAMSPRNLSFLLFSHSFNMGKPPAEVVDESQLARLPCHRTCGYRHRFCGYRHRNCGLCRTTCGCCHANCGFATATADAEKKSERLGKSRLRLGHQRVVDHLDHGIVKMQRFVFLRRGRARLVVSGLAGTLAESLAQLG